jgi:xylulokinase
MSLLGIDIGTSGCKSAVFSSAGQMLSLAYEEYDSLEPQPGWAELDARQVWEKVCRTIRAAAADPAVVKDPIQALCVASLGEAVGPLSARREILAPSLLNFDARGAEFLPALRASLSAERLYALNGNTLGSPYSLTKLKWIKQYQPDLYQRTAYFMHWSGFVSYLLGAEPRVDYSLANRTLLFDLQQETWSQELLDWAGLDGEKLPPPVPTGAVIGAVAGVIAADLGIPSGIPIVSGAHDQSSNALGCGVVEPGHAMYGMGTYLCAVPVFTQRPDTALMMARGLNTEHHAVPGRFVSFIYNQGGILVKWYRDTFARMERDQMRASGGDIYAALLAEMPDAPARVIVLPHFTMTGPPHFIQDTSGVIAGLKLNTSRGEILKGILEATTFYLRESFETLPGAGIEITQFRAVGGGSKSDLWVQLCADILGRPFVRPRVSEAGAMGAAILAGVGAGLFPTQQAGVEAMVTLEKVFEPDAQKHALYTARFERYTRLAPLMADYLRTL